MISAVLFISRGSADEPASYNYETHQIIRIDNKICDQYIHQKRLEIKRCTKHVKNFAEPLMVAVTRSKSELMHLRK